ncbi:HAD family hydrolase [Parabacteroides faecis]|uniref:HAD family hydrolase n=1 Tax=Parabacteroides TaxID=375288 RepID=UPI000EFDC0A9|nr:MULTISPECIES: HAD family hydrolase [Parabacteroides]MBC8617554.1 HAD family hydrolase [Parabacteroides faecis]RHR99569.1 HAD family hydrolase [Parabacteroides sp. AF14-59]
MKNKIFVFDLDDTLYKEIDFLHSAYREIAQWVELKFSLNDIYPFMLRAYENKSDVFSLLIRTYNLPLTKDDLLDMYRLHFPVICLDSDTEDVLNVLNLDYRLGMITDGRSITQRNKYRALELDRFIDDNDLVISEEFGSEKPSEKNFLFFQDKYINTDFFYIGDNLRKDFITPNRLGWTTICLIDDGRNIHRQDFSCPEVYLPQLTINTLEDLLSLPGKNEDILITKNNYE